LAPASNSSLPEDKFFINNDVVKAIRARVALFEGNYILAETLANEIIGDVDEEYALAFADDVTGIDDEPLDYADIWQFGDMDSPAIICALSRLQNDPGVAANWYANRVDIEGSPFLQMSVQLYNSYDDTDLRKILFTAESAAQPIGQPADGSDIILVGKYQAQ